MPLNLTQSSYINAVIGLYIMPSRNLSPTQNKHLQQFPQSKNNDLRNFFRTKNNHLQPESGSFSPPLFQDLWSYSGKAKR